MKLILLFLVLTLTHEIHGQDCGSDLKTGKDKFTGKVTVNSPLEKRVTFFKSIEKQDTSYAVMVSVLARSRTISPNGVYILFEDGSKLIKEDFPVGVEYVTGGVYYYYSEIKVTPDELEDFIIKRVTDVRLHLHESEVKERDGKRIMCYAKSILTR